MRLSGMRGNRLRVAAALVVAGLAAIALYGYLRGLEERTAKGGPLLQVAVAAADIRAGQRIRSDCVEWTAMPERYLTGGMLRSGVENRVALHDIGRGELLLAGDLSSGVDAGSVALRLPPGRRGYPLSLERISLPAGALQPGDRLDVLVADGEACELILEEVVLLDLLNPEGAGSSLPGASVTGAGFAVLQLTPDEAERLGKAAGAESASIILVICPLERG